jgi:hypothetical protein
MRRSAWVVTAVTAVTVSTGCSNGPSCSDAFKNFYAAGCTVRDGSGSAIALDAEISSCQTTETQLGSNSTCESDFQTYLSCLDGVSDGSDTQACSSCFVQQAMVADCQLGSSS